MRHMFRFLTLTVAAGTWVGCADAAENAGEQPAPPTVQAIGGSPMSLSSMDSLTVQLEQGGAVAADGTRVTLLAAYSAEGDFDDDGIDETAALVVAEPGGTGVMMNLVAFRHGPDGGLVQVADRLLGDRQKIHRFEAVADSLLVEITTQAPGDPMCCPTRRAQQVYLIRDGVWRLWRDNTLSASPPDIQDGVQRRDSSLEQAGPVRGGEGTGS